MSISIKAKSMASGLAAIAAAYDRDMVGIQPALARERSVALDHIANIANNIVRPVLSTERVVMTIEVTHTIMVHGTPPPITQCAVNCSVYIWDATKPLTGIKTPEDYGLTDY